jgi:hypothetical protein
MGDFSKVYAMQPAWEKDPNIESAWPKLAHKLLPLRFPNGVPWGDDDEAWDAVEAEARYWLGQTPWPSPPPQLQRTLEMLRGGWWDADSAWADAAFSLFRESQRQHA